MIINTAFSYTKSKWKRWPIIEVDDVSDLTVLKNYNNYPFVWLKNKRYEILESFNWNFYPESNKQNSIHSFPVCIKGSKRPIDWTALHLVPTTADKNTNINKCQQIAGYIESLAPMYIYAFNDKHAIKKYNRLANIERQCHLIRTKNNMAEVYELLDSQRPVWLINADVTIDNYDFLNFESSDADLYMFDVIHQSTGLTYADESVQLISPSYLQILAGDIKREPIIKHINKKIGSVNDVTDPFKAWANAYYTTLYLKNTNIAHLKKKKNNILGTYIQPGISRINEYLRAGVEEAETDSQLNNYVFETFTKWDKILDRFNKWKNRTTNTPEELLLQKRLQGIKKTYGENSEEYQKLSNQLDKSVESR